ncbi:VOC family protein [Glaciibacter flavus]|uniref:VOC family protein n=1 Tax=Orlajensenia flava TaxID=2565934 RepID=A0A4S4FX51_9MICO|nr:VOC family protein [Glaciibacter flavus]THG35134.1 VOC family protein [Glaciibacter flavus]
MASSPSASPSVRFHHVGIDVLDLDAAIAFYTEALGLEEQWRLDSREYDFTLVWLGNEAGLRLELFHREGVTRGPVYDPDNQHDVTGIKHFSVAVPSASAVHSVHGRLIAAGATSHMPPSPSPDPSKLMAYVADPEGNLIELVESD